MELPAARRTGILIHAARRRVYIVLLLLPATGCHLIVGLSEALDPSSDSPSSETPAADPPLAGQTPSDQPARDAATSGPVRSVLDVDGWVRRIAADGIPAERPRWRHAQLEDLLARPPAALPAFDEWLDDPSAVVAANAAIALARLQRTSGVARLAATVRNPQLSLAHRSAAAEALGALDNRDASAAIRSLLKQYGAGDERAQIPELHAELVRAYSAQHRPELESILQRALKSRSVMVRLAALDVWPRRPGEALPALVYEMANSSDARVRSAAIPLIVARDTQKADTIAARGLADHDLQVRLASIRALGTLDGDATGRQLRTLLDDPAATIRAEAVAALAQRGQFRDVYEVAADKSWRVRQQVAHMLCQDPSAAAAAVAEQLVADSSGRVALAALHGVESWPLPLAGPILLAAAESPSYQVRKAAARQLQRQWPDAADFPWDGSSAQRASVIAQLRSRWADQVATELPEASTRLATHRRTSAEDIRTISQAVELLSGRDSDPAARRRAIARLTTMGPDLVTAMDAYVAQSHLEIPDVIYEKVLPEAAPIFADLARMRDGRHNERRHAARRLADQWQGKELPCIAAKRLADIVTAESDADVWRSALGALADDGREPAIRLHRAGMTHPDAGVRCQACRYLARHGGAARVDWLLSALDDADRSVVRAAVEGLASAEQLPDPLPLIRLLADRDPLLTVDVAYALARHGHTSGEAALQRLAKSADNDVRREAARAMGRLANSVFAATLVDMLDDRLEIKRAAARGLEAMLGPDMTGANQAPNESLDVRISRLRRWFAANGHQLVRPLPSR